MNIGFWLCGVLVILFVIIGASCIIKSVDVEN